MAKNAEKSHPCHLHTIVNTIFESDKTANLINSDNSLEKNLQQAEQFFTDYFKIQGQTSVQPWYGEKNDELSAYAKKEGNAYFLKKDLKNAKWYYFLAISSMQEPCSDEGRHNLAILFSNLSAVYFDQNSFDNCLEAISISRETKVVEKIQEKLEKREQTVKLIQKMSEDEALKVAETDAVPTEFDCLANCKNPNFNLPFANKNITLESDTKFGGCRLMKATEHIQVGELVIVEPATASHLNAEMLTEKCAHCFKSLVAPVGCRSCTGVMYCSWECEKLGWLEDGHGVECKYLCSMIQSGPGWLAFRMFWKGFMFSSEYCEGRKSFEPVDTELKIIKNDYPSIMNLHKENPTYFTDLKLVILYAIGFTKIMLQENRIDDKNQNLDAVKKL